jgi:hypothetical protein
MSKLEWKVLTKKRENATKGVPPGKEALAWVTNTVTLIYGQHDAMLVDTRYLENCPLLALTGHRLSAIPLLRHVNHLAEICQPFIDLGRSTPHGFLFD